VLYVLNVDSNGEKINMRKRIKKLSTILVASILLLNISAVGSIAPSEKENVIIVFKDNQESALAQGSALVKEHEGEIERQLTSINAIATRLSKDKIETLKKHPGIEYIEPDYEAEALGDLVEDSVEETRHKDKDKGPSQVAPWGITKINADKAWQVTNDPNKGKGIKVAILDTGIQYDHPDLQANIKGGVNFVGSGSRDGSTDPKRWTDKNGHGTHVAGTIAAEDNGIGVVGVAPQASLYAVKVLNNQGKGSYSDIIQGIDWAVKNDMQVISMSLGGKSDSKALKKAVDNARAKGVIVVAAAGNSGDGNPATNNVIYPAKYDSTIAVAATNSKDAVAKFSSDGKEVDVAAPGVSVHSTYKGSSYKAMNGTSMATPHVTGTVALMLSAGISPGKIQSKLEKTAVDLSPSGYDVFTGHGRIDALKATQ